jgi:hypothetical protein
VWVIEPILTVEDQISPQGIIHGYGVSDTGCLLRSLEHLILPVLDPQIEYFVSVL